MEVGLAMVRVTTTAETKGVAVGRRIVGVGLNCSPPRPPLQPPKNTAMITPASAMHGQIPFAFGGSPGATPLEMRHWSAGSNQHRQEVAPAQ